MEVLFIYAIPLVFVLYFIIWSISKITCNKCHNEIWPTKICPHCHDDPRATYKNCNYCNDRIRASIDTICPSCGHNPNAKYVVCSYCDKKTEYKNQICPFCQHNPHEFRPVTKMFNLGKKLVNGISDAAPKIGEGLKRGVQIAGHKMLHDFLRNL